MANTVNRAIQSNKRSRESKIGKVETEFPATKLK
jgi:hypothetical protein